MNNLERILKINMNHTIKSGIWIIASQLMVSVGAFITTIILAHILDKDIFGQYRFVITVMQVIGIFTIPSVGTAIIRSVARGHNLNWKHILISKIKYGLLASILSIGVSGYYYLEQNLSLAHIYLMIGIIIPFYELFFIYNPYLNGIKDFKHASLYIAITRSFQAVIIVITALLTHNTILMVLSFFVGLLIPQAFFYLRTINIHLIEQPNEPEPTLMKYALRLTILDALILITGSLDKIFTWHYFGAEQFASYVIALTLPLNILLIFNFLPQIYFPHISSIELDRTHITKALTRMALLFLVLALIAGTYVLVAPALLPFLFTKYQSSVAITIVLAWLIPLMPLNTIITKIFQAHKMVWRIFSIRIFYAFVFGIIYFTIQQQFEILTPAISFICSEASALIFGLMLLYFIKKPA